MLGIAALGLALISGGASPVATASRAAALLVANVTASAPTEAPDPPDTQAIPIRIEGDAPSLSAAKPTELNLGFALMHIPAGFSTDNGDYDLVIHFHGAPTTVEPAFDATGIPAVLVIMNLGIGSGSYEQRFQDSAGLDRTLVGIQGALTNRLPELHANHLRRLAVSAWSAGFGAVARILAFEHNRERIDAVLLEDGMHAAYLDKLSREVDPHGMEPFAAFARAAAQGDKLMSVTHSEIKTIGYASTTETSAYLIKTLGAELREVRSEGPGHMIMISRADRRGLHVRAYEGADAAAHCEHLYGIGQTVLPDLEDRWSRI